MFLTWNVIACWTDNKAEKRIGLVQVLHVCMYVHFIGLVLVLHACMYVHFTGTTV